MRRLLSIPVLLTLIAGCGSSGGPDKSGGRPASSGEPGSAVTLRYAASDPSPAVQAFFADVQRRSGGQIRIVPVPNDDDDPRIDTRLAKDVSAGRLDVALMAARAWDELGVRAVTALQTPFLISSRTLLDRVAAAPQVIQPLWKALAPEHVTGLALVPVGVRYLLSRRPLSAPAAFSGVKVRVNPSQTTSGIITDLGATPVENVRSGTPVEQALQAGRLDAVETDPPTAVAHSYQRPAPYLNTALPLFAKASTLVANTSWLRRLSPRARAALADAATAYAKAAQSDAREKAAWTTLCASGLKVSHDATALAQLHARLTSTLATIDADLPTQLIEDRIARLAIDEPRTDPWARCGGPDPSGSPTKVLDGAYTYDVTAAALARRGAADPQGNAAAYTLLLGNGRWSILSRKTTLPNDQFPGWDFKTDPIDGGMLVVHGGTVSFINDVGFGPAGEAPGSYRFELFRHKLRLKFVSGIEDFNLTTVPLNRAG